MADGGIPPIPNGRGRGNPSRPFGRGRATRTIQTADVVCIGRGRGRGTAGPSANIVHTSSPYLRLRQAMGLGSGQTVNAVTDKKPMKKEDSVKSQTQENSSSTDKQECLNPSRSEVKDTTKEPTPETSDSTERNANAVTDKKPMKKEDSVKSQTQENSSSTDKQECLNPSRSEVKDTTKEPTPETSDSTERNANAGHSNLSIEAPEFHPAEDVSCLTIMSNLSIDAPEFHPAEDINRLPIMEPDCREMCPSQNVDNVDESPLDDAEAILDFCFGELIATPDVFEDVMQLFKNNFIQFVLSDIVLLEVIKDLYMKAEAYPAFTYNAMRMLIRMIKLERKAHNSTSVRDKLLNFAKDQLQKTLASAKVGRDVNMMAPLLFAAEMYIQLKVGGLRLSRVGEAIVQILYSYMCLDHIPARERYLNTVKILKLIGSSLEEDVPGSLQEAINMLLSEISQESGLDKSTNETVNNFLKTVLSMTDETAAEGNARSNLSGAAQTEQDRSCPPQVAECPPQVAECPPQVEECPPQVEECPPQVEECPPQVAENHPILYGPDGAALSAEEEAFLQSIMSVVDSPCSSPRSSAVAVDDLGQLSD